MLSQELHNKLPIGDVVRALRKHKKWSLEELAQKITDYDTGNLSKFERGKQGIKETKLNQIAAAFDISIKDIYSVAEQLAISAIQPEDIPLAAQQLMRTLEANPAQINEHNAIVKDPTNALGSAYQPDQITRIPIISFVQAGQWVGVEDPFLPGDADEWRETTSKVSKSSFALRVKGDSMHNPVGTPSIPEGSIVTVDPQMQAENGNIIIAKLEDTQEVTIKKLVIDGPNTYLKPLNPAYSMFPIDDNCSIVGVVKKIEFDL